MLALERLMRPFAVGEEDVLRRPLLTPLLKLRAPSLHSGRQLSQMKELSEPHKFGLEQLVASATDKSKDRKRASEGAFELQDDAGQLLPQKVCTVP